MSRRRLALAAGMAVLCLLIMGAVLWSMATAAHAEIPEDLDPLGTWTVQQFPGSGGPWRFLIADERIEVTDPAGRVVTAQLRIEREAPHLVLLHCTPAIQPFGTTIGMGCLAGGGTTLTAHGQGGDAVRETP